MQNLRNDHKRKHTSKKLQEFFGKNPDSNNNFFEQSFSTKSLLDAHSGETEVDMDKFACFESTFIMRANYKVSRANNLSSILTGLGCLEDHGR